MSLPPPSHLLPTRAALVVGTVFVGILALGFASSLIALTRTQRPAGEEIATGAWSAEFERRFDREQPFRQAAIDTWGVLEYALFGDGSDGVLIGDDGWLYTTEEFLAGERDDAEAARKLDDVERVRDRLAASGSALVVVLVPAKARIYPEQLGRHRLPRELEDRYRHFRSALIAAGIHAPDLVTLLLEAKSRAPVFLRTDTHWTPFGAHLAAEAVADHAAEHDLLPSRDASDYRSLPTDPVLHRGDLLEFVPLGPLQERIGPAPDTLERFELETPAAGAGAAGLFGQVEIPVTLVGTSYSADPRWNFENALKVALGTDVLNVADEGLGPMAPMEDYLASERFAASPPELVVWEIPERFLGVEY